MALKKIMSLCVGLLCTATMATSSMAKGPPADRHAHKQDICHFENDTGVFSLINISKKAVDAHIAKHGDVDPGSYFADTDGDGLGDADGATDSCPNEGFVDNHLDACPDEFAETGDGCPAPTFTLGSDVLVGQNLYWTHSGNVAMLLNNGDMTFTQSNLNTRLGIGPIRVGDLDGDGYDDFVASHSGAQNYVGLGVGGGQFSIFDIGITESASAIEIADINSDGNLDLALAINGWYRGVVVALGDGSGAFSVSADLATWGSTRQIDSGDIDGDGNIDLVTANAQGNHAMEIFWGDGSGSSFTKETVDSNTGSVGAAIVDIDGDGDLDVVTGGLGDTWSGTLRVYRNPGGGNRNLGGAEIFGDMHGHLHFMEDVTDDGFPDAVTTGSYGGGAYYVAVYPNDGYGNFNMPPQVYTLPDSFVLCGGCDATLGDFNEDSVKDLAIANGSSGSISILLGDGYGAFGLPEEYSGLTRTVSIAAGNFD